MNFFKLVLSITILCLFAFNSDAQFFKRKKKSSKVTTTTKDTATYTRFPTQVKTNTQNEKQILATVDTNTQKQEVVKSTLKKNTPQNNKQGKQNASRITYSEDEVAPPPVTTIKQEEEKNSSIKERLKRRQQESNSRIDKLIETKMTEVAPITPTEEKVVTDETKSTIPLEVMAVEDNNNNSIIDEQIIEETIEDKKKSNTYAQNPETWKLDQCISYALVNNLQINESELNTRLTSLTLEETKASRYPTLNIDVNNGKRFGRSIDPYTNQFSNNTLNYNSLNAASQVLLFGWFQKKYAQEKNEFEVLAATSTNQQIKNDVALNITTGFLRILLAREQVKIHESQLKLDKDQLAQTKKFVSSGKLPELHVAQMEAQLSSDSALYVSAKSEERMAILQLKALMNFDFDKKFNITAPTIDAINYFANYRLPDAQTIYETAIKNQEQIKFNQYKLLAAQKALLIAKATRYPQLSFGANTGSTFSNTAKNIIGQTYTGTETLGYVNVGTTEYPISRPTYKYTTQTIPWGTQYKNNWQTNAGIMLNIPVLNGRTARTNIDRAKIAYVSQKIALDNTSLLLKQDIYKSYEDVKTALQKYNANSRSKVAAQRAVDFATKRFDAGLMSTFDYSTTLNTLYKANSSVLAAKYELLFKLKVLDYYMGNPLKL